MSTITLTISSPLDRERVVVEGGIGREQLFELSNEPDRPFTLEIYPQVSGEPWRMGVDDLIRALVNARKELDYPAAQGEL